MEQRTPANRRQSLTRSQRRRRCAGVPPLAVILKTTEIERIRNGKRT